MSAISLSVRSTSALPIATTNSGVSGHFLSSLNRVGNSQQQTKSSKESDYAQNMAYSFYANKANNKEHQIRSREARGAAESSTEPANNNSIYQEALIANPKQVEECEKAELAVYTYKFGSIRNQIGLLGRIKELKRRFMDPFCVFVRQNKPPAETTTQPRVTLCDWGMISGTHQGAWSWCRKKTTTQSTHLPQG